MDVSSRGRKPPMVISLAKKRSWFTRRPGSEPIKLRETRGIAAAAICADEAHRFGEHYHQHLDAQDQI